MKLAADSFKFSGIVKSSPSTLQHRNLIVYRLPNFLQLLLLLSPFIEITLIQPRLQHPLPPLPLPIQHGSPPRIPVLAPLKHVLPKQALIHKPKPQRRTPRRLVARIALPLPTPVAQVLKHVSAQQIQRLGGRGRALQQRAEEHMADLADAVFGVDAHEGETADGGVRGV